MTCHYSRLHVLLHWTFATIIIWATISGFSNALLTLPRAVSHGINFINVSLTFLLIPLFFLRVLCALNHQETITGKRSFYLLAKTGHLLLYIATAVTLLTGVLMMDRPLNILGLFELPQPLNDHVLTQFFNRLHKYSCSVLALLVAGHISAVIVHHTCGDKILRRMSL